MAKVVRNRSYGAVGMFLLLAMSFGSLLLDAHGAWASEMDLEAAREGVVRDRNNAPWCEGECAVGQICC